MSEYRWRRDWQPGGGLDAQVAGEEIARISRDRGAATAAVVLDEARSRRSVLHNAVFDVDESEAAERYYLERVRKIIQAIVVVTPETTGAFVRAFQFVRPEPNAQPSYVPAETVAADAYMRDQIQTMLLAKIRALRNELKAWEQFQAVVAVLDEVLDAA